MGTRNKCGGDADQSEQLCKKKVRFIVVNFLHEKKKKKKVTENSKIKCYKYWPSAVKSKTFGQFVVTLSAKEKEHGLVTRLVNLERKLPDQEPETRQIYHFQ